MLTLVHHALDSEPGALSPFVKYINTVAEGSDVRIACPYVSLRVLRSLVGKARRWRWLTDAEELLRSHAPSNRAELLKFLADHQERVRHWPDLHAKVVAGDASALLGSANLTEMGLGKRQEIGVLLDEPAIVGQLHCWFDALWSRCQAVPPAALNDFAAALPRALTEAPGVRLTSPAPAISAALFPAAEPPNLASGEDELRERLSRAASREWANAYLDLCADLLATLELKEDDARLVMSVPTSSGLPVTINQRYVLCAFHRGRKVVGMMLPHDLQIPAELVPAMANVREHMGGFKAWHDEKPEEVPGFAYFEVEDPRELLPLRDEWLYAVMRETERPWKHSSFRRMHVPAFFRAAIDKNFRAALLNRAFSPARPAA